MIYDSKTTNLSFIKMYKILKALGIKNNKFFLKLYDRTLQNVNPLDEKNLTNLQKEKIKIEIKRNPWYFLREIVVLSVAGGTKRFELHRGNLAMCYCILNCLNSITILPRQHGKTVSSLAVYVWIYYFGTENSNILFINKELSDAIRNLKTFKDTFDLLPNYLKYMIDSKRDKDNIQYIESSTTGNTIKVIGSAITTAEADKKGRGCTTPLQLWDEMAFLKYNKEMYLAAAPASTQAKIEAKNNNKIYGTTLITTPNSIDVPEGAFCKNEIIDKACTFDESMYDWTIDEINDCIAKKSDNNFLYIEFSYKQLGKSEEWYKNQCRDLLNDALKIKREILLEWTKSSDLSVYSEEQLTLLESLIKQPKSKLTINQIYFIELYKTETELNFNKTYIISCDCSTGMENDASAITIFDPITLEIIGEFRENKIDTFDYKELIIQLVIKYFPNAVVVIENNSIGKAILDSLMKSIIANRIYWEYQTRTASKMEVSKTVLNYKSKKVKVQIGGVSTTTASRPLMLEILNETINNEPEIIATRNIYSDIKDLERNKKGKIEHRVGGHDDSLFSYLIGRYVLAYGTNLARFMLPLKRGEAYEDHAKRLHEVGARLSKLNTTPADLRGEYNFTRLGNIAIEENELMQKSKVDNNESNKKLNFFKKILID